MVPPTDKPIEGAILVLAKSTANTDRDINANGDETECLPAEGKVTSQTTWLELEIEERQSKKRPKTMLIPAKKPDPITVIRIDA